jgi:hypothetical protein
MRDIKERKKEERGEWNAKVRSGVNLEVDRW